MILELESLLDSSLLYNILLRHKYSLLALIVWARLLRMHLFEIISQVSHHQPSSPPAFPICTICLPDWSDLILICSLVAGLGRLMADNYCDLSVDNVVHHHQQECGGAPLQSTPVHSPPGWLIHNQKSGPVISQAVTKLSSVCNN